MRNFTDYSILEPPSDPGQVARIVEATAPDGRIMTTAGMVFTERLVDMAGASEMSRIMIELADRQFRRLREGESA